MNKRELIARVQRHMGAGSTRDAARAAVNAVLESILQAAAEGKNVHIARLGNFEYRERRQRSGQGLPGITSDAPRPLTRRLHFRPARRLKARTESPQRPAAH